MRQKIIFSFGLFLISTLVWSQSNIDQVLAEIEQNNSGLISLREKLNAEKVGNRTGIYLENPEVGFNYLWGNPSAIGNRTDFSVTQSFDFPTAYRYRKQIGSIKNEQLELEYQKQRRELKLQARILLSKLIYSNALSSELGKRLEHAQTIANSYQAKFDAGEVNILENNKARLNLIHSQKEMEREQIEQDLLLSELTAINGGIDIEFPDLHYVPLELLPDFEQWYLLAEENSPMLNWLKKQIEISQKEIKLSNALNLPKLHAGYMSEKVVGEQFQGLSLGVSIPLWENKNSVKFSKANALALESVRMDHQIKFYQHLKALHTKTIALQKQLQDYKKNVVLLNHAELLNKALELGEISLIEYTLELSIYYDGIDYLLELERDLNLTMAELNQYQE